MRFRGFGRVRRRPVLPGTSWRRWVVVAVGLGVLVAALVGAVGPVRQTVEFRGAIDCDRESAGCLDSEPGSVVDRRTYTTTSTTTDANGSTNTTTTTHYEITWQAADGARQSRDVSSSFYAKAPEGEPVTLRLWEAEVVGVEVMGGVQWFLPESGTALRYWLYLAHLGLGILLWGLLFGWWDGLFMLGFRAFAWMFLCFLPVGMLTDALAYGLDGGIGLVVQLGFAAFFVGIAGFMLVGSLDRW
ncbi:hypothetical protein [Pseudonocardia lacus]|uniref:hypothetical protein n=1 Tax=Pseudonocardia lacus TaxID=2835865 RepID=UPI001BDD3866|nr:hypothetical protein [Pseudonocardia lacus]